MNKILDYIYLTGFHFGLGPEVHRTLRVLNSSNNWDNQRLLELQRQKLIRLLENAIRRTCFYDSSLYREGLFAIRNDVEFSIDQLPVLTKEIVRSQSANMRSEDIGRTYSSRTGGTTGNPLEIYKCIEGVSWALAALWRGRSIGGIGIWDRGILANGFTTPTRKGSLRMRLLNKHLMQAFGTGVDKRQEFATLLGTGKIKFIEGYASGLQELSADISQKVEGVKAVFTTGEMLYSHQRETLSKRLNAPVYNYYGSNEIGGIAFECEQGELHVTDEHVMIETLNEANDPVWDQLGRIVVTDLDNQAMPLIRYEIGDQGVLTRKPCACGRSHTRLLQLCGRGQEFLDNAKGVRLPVTFFMGRFRNLTEIGRVQLVQHDHSRIDVLFDGLGDNADGEAQWLVKEIQAGLGQEVEVSRKRVTNLFQTDRGKIPLIRRMFL